MTPAARIGYATNVHPGRTLDQALGEIERHAPRVRERLVERGVLAASEPLPLGAWFSSEAARALLAEPGRVERTAERLATHGLRVRSLNGFPYGHFHADRVKHAVYRPSWAQIERLLYTESLAEILARFTVAGAGANAHATGRSLAGAPPEASISTVPVGWRSEIHSAGGGAALGAAITNLRALAASLERVEGRFGVRVRVDLEPEPGCTLDESRGVVQFFERLSATRRGAPDPRRHLGVCHDVCHAAVMWESQGDALARLRGAGIVVGRAQLSSALEWRPAIDADRVAAFAEPRYLHQTTLRDRDGSVRFFEDLPDALVALRREPADDGATARTHLHVPLSSERAGELATTRSAVGDFLAAWPADEALPPLEVETYTWEVLPEPLRPASLADGIAAEIEWAHAEVARRRGASLGARSGAVA